MPGFFLLNSKAGEFFLNFTTACNNLAHHNPLTMSNNQWLRYLVAFIAPVLFGLLFRYFFTLQPMAQWYTVMSWSFLVFLPLLLGILTTFLAEEKLILEKKYRFLLPWIAVLIFALITLTTQQEGWACWIMAAPFFLVASAVGGFIGAWIRLRKGQKGKMYVSLLALMPFLLSPVEHAITLIPAQYEAYTSIDIAAPKENIWPNVTRVRAIAADDDKGWFTRFLGFPRPIRAELNFEGVGAYRKAIFDKGLVFDERVTKYQHLVNMTFSIKANPHEIPAATMDDHIVIGGKYFDVLDGTYALEQLNDSTCRLHLYSHFKMSTSFNSYASIWARWIMQDIQNNILQIIQRRSVSDQLP